MKWFKHDTDANMDAKLQEVMLDYGLEGYGLYWYCIELIAQRVNGDNLTFELEHDCRIIARNTGSTPQKVEQMMKSFILLGLLDADNGHVFCLKLASRCDDFTAKAVRRKGVKPVVNQEVGVCPSLSVFVHLEEEEEVRKRSKKKIKDIVHQDEPTPFDFWWDRYPRKEAKVAAEKIFNKKIKGMSEDQLCAFMDNICNHSTTTYTNTKKEFMPLPTSYLNQERYNDE